MSDIQRGLVELLHDLDRRARPGREPKNRAISKFLTIPIDTVTLSSETVTTTVQTPPYQYARQSYRSAVVTDAPVAYWRFNENYPATGANDEMGGGTYTGTYTSSVGRGATGPGLSEPGLSCVFAGTTASYIQVPSATGLNITSNLTVEAWVRAESTAASATICGRGGGGTTQLQWLLVAEALIPRFYVGSGAALISAAGTILTTGVWYHLVGTYTGTSGARLQVNGAAPTTSAALLAALLSETTGPRIGLRPDNLFPWSGGIDDVAVYNTVLSSARGLAHYSAMTTPTATGTSLVVGAGQFR